jgi:hypothetical protein
MAEIVVVTGNLLTFLESVEVTRPDNLIVQVPSDTFQIFQFAQVEQNPKHVSVGNFFSIIDDAHLTNPVAKLTNTLQFVQQVIRTKYGNAVNYISFTQNTRTVGYEILNDTFMISQSLSVSRGLTNNLIYTQTVSFNIVKVQQITQSLSLIQAVRIYKYNDPRFVAIDASSGTQDFTPITLVYGPITLPLCIPDFGDKDEINVTRVNRETRAGGRIIYKDPIWPIVETLTFKLSNLNQIQVKTLLDFIQNTLGTTITLIDHYGTTWVGIITNPEAQAEQNVIVRRDNCPAFSIELSFQGQHA